MSRARVLFKSWPLIAVLSIGGVFATAHDADAKPKKPKAAAKKKLSAEDKADEDAFKARFTQLSKEKNYAFFIRMAAVDDPSAIPGSASAGGLTMVAGKRQIQVPELLSADDIHDVVNDHLRDVKTCYKKQLEADPEWDDELILDLAIKKTGRVSEVGIAPRRVKKDVIGLCLLSEVPKWKFPEFSGETDDGVTQEVVTASFPFTMSQK